MIGATGASSEGITSVAAMMLAEDRIAANVLAANLKTPPREGLLKNAHSRTTACRRSIRQKSSGARRQCFDRYLSSGLGRSQSSPCRGQRQLQQGLREEPCDRKGDEGSLP